MIKLTEKTYHTPKNTYLTNSKIGVYLKSPKRFLEQCVLGTYKSEPTQPMILGSAVDKIVTGSMAKFNKEFYVADLRKEEAQPGKIRLTAGQYKDAITIATKLLSTTAVKDLKNHKRQVILTWNHPIGSYLDGYAVMLDFLSFEDDGRTAIITDLKTGGKPTAREWTWKCEDMGYFRQAGLFSYVVRLNFPKVERVIFRHVCAEKNTDGLVGVYVYRVEDERIQYEINRILNVYVPMIANDKEFKDEDTKWSDEVLVGGYDY